MPSVLLIVTIVSVAVAAVMTFVAWRTVREERRRSAARIAALEAELGAGDVPAFTAAPGPRPFRNDPPIPAPSLAIAEHREPQARPVQPPIAHEHREPPARPIEPQRVRAPQPITWDATEVATSGEVFTGAQRSGPGIPRFAIVALVIAVTVGGAAAAILTRDPDAAGHAATATVADLAAQAPALELVALRHQRAGDSWTITGLVRNGAGAGAVKDLTVVAFTFDRDGGFLASGRAPLEFPTLRPGDESPFSVTVTTPGSVGRYRVSFRAADGSMLKHLDRR